MKTITSFLGIIISAFVLASCDIETSDNGPLDGYWHLTRVDTLSTGGACDFSSRRVFWGVQAGLLNVCDYDVAFDGYLMHFENDGLTLRVFNPYTDDRKEGDVKVEDPELLAPLGINALDETFRIEVLSGKSMMLATDKLRLNFRKM